ncbi:MAG: phosphohistidine phosphatase SixA [Gemmatimonadaceae bacterium]|nr:phosphohistidine phosphatase SixA [Gemmatimonadaceae bacterium]
MQLLVVRHAIAEERADFARRSATDEERPLTDKGREKMKRSARGLRRVLPSISRLACSPLTRSTQTAAILAEEYQLSRTWEIDELRPSRPIRDFLPWLASHDEHEIVAIVGHEPYLGSLVTWLMTGMEDPAVAFKKGGALLLDFPGQVTSGAATLVWAMAPAQLRRLGE